jgi:hypothetical protein
LFSGNFRRQQGSAIPCTRHQVWHAVAVSVKVSVSVKVFNSASR